MDKIEEIQQVVQKTIRFLAPCQQITEYYIETRFPIGINTSLQPESLQVDLDTTRKLISLILRKVTP